MIRSRSLHCSLLVGVLVVSSGCASTHMKKFIGRDARDVAVEDGPPVNVFDLPDGQRVFQYAVDRGSYVRPKTTTATQVQLLGDSAHYSEQKLNAGGNSLQNAGCYITYLARWNAEKQGWIVADILYPKPSAC